MAETPDVINNSIDGVAIEPVIKLGYTSTAVNSDKFFVDEMLEDYLFGIDLSDSNGNPLPHHLFVHHLNSAISYCERVLGIQINQTEQEEFHDYHQSDYSNWCYLQLFKYPAIKVTKMSLTYGTQEGFVVPNDWIKLNKLTGQLQMFPSHGSASGMIINSYGTIIGMHNSYSYAPQMWKINYTSGLDEVPADMYEFVYKKAVIGILQVWGDLILGAGIASQSVSIDGLSQSIGTTQSAMYGGASARCEEYRKDIDRLIPALKQTYTGIRMVVI